VRRGLNMPGDLSSTCGPRQPARAEVGLGGSTQHGRVQRGHGWAAVMTSGPQRSATAARAKAGERLAASWAGWAVCSMGCCAGGPGWRPASDCGLRREAGPRRRAIVLGVVWTSLGPLPRWVPGPTTRWALGTTRLVLHGT
jgi:hypothetical protein